MRSSRLAFAAALAAALFALLSATGGEARKKTCKVRGSDTSFTTKSLRVFTTGADSLKYFVCYRKTGKKTKIGVQTGPEQTATYKPAGRFVPFINYGTPPVRWTARLLDAKSGKLKFDFVTLKKYDTTAALVATPSGGIAFVLDEANDEGDEDARDLPRRFVVGHKAGTGKHAYTKLTAGGPPEATSLTRKGDVVSWTIYGGIKGSADLGP